MSQIHEPKSLNIKRPAVEENLEEEVVEKKIKPEAQEQVQAEPRPQIEEEVAPPQNSEPTAAAE